MVGLPASGSQRSRILFLSALVLSSLSAFLFFGCAPKPRLLPEARTPENVLKCALDSQMEFETLACLVKLKLRGQEAKFSGTIEFFYKDPHTFAFQPRTLFGIGGFKAGGKNDSLTIYFPKQNEFYRGSFSDFDKGTWGGWNMPFPILLEAILGKSGLSDSRLRYAGREKETFLYELEDQVWLRTYWIDARSCRLIQSRWTQKQEGGVFQVEYGSFREDGRAEIPGVIIIRSGSTGSANLKFLERRLDLPIPDGKFDLQIPSDAARINSESPKK